MRPADAPAILDVYNHYVRHSSATFDIEPFSLTSRRSWFELFVNDVYRCFVATDDGRLLGYAACTPFREKPAYRPSVEVSVYVAPDHLNRGVGSALYATLLPTIANSVLHRAYACITLPNVASIALHEKHGFHRVGHHSEAGFKFDRYWDIAWYEKALD